MVDANHRLWAELFSYPAEERADSLRAVLDQLGAEAPEVRADLQPLLDQLDHEGPSAVEELFVRTFENNSERALELGWHLFGENYSRGSFMARMRAMLRQHDIAETVELPDHLSHMLLLLGRADADLRQALSHQIALPALKKIREGFDQSDNPYLPALTALERCLTRSLETTAVGDPS